MFVRSAIRSTKSRRRRAEGDVAGRAIRAGSLLLLLVALAPICSTQGQTSPTDTTAGSVSAAAGASSSPASPMQAQSAAVAADGSPADEANRKALEERAGLESGKLLFRSVPGGAKVFVDDKYVGRTPLLLIVAPGKYKIGMQGPRQETGEETVDLGPKETRQIALTLTARYPDRVAAR